MDEDLNDEELDNRTDSVIRNVDQARVNDIDGVKDKEANFTQSTPRVSTFRRYWHKSDDDLQQNNRNEHHNQSDFKQINNKEVGTNRSEVLNISSHVQFSSDTIQGKPKKERLLPDSRDYKPDSLVANTNVKKSGKTINNGNKAEIIVELQSSDDDDVVEVALPPKPTITIESSDDEELTILTPASNKEIMTITALAKKGSPNSPKNLGTRPRDFNRDVSASPVPSVVSSVSDDFIRGDCIAFNISSKRPEQPTFDFSVHGSDLVIPASPVSHKKKKKRNKHKTAALTMTNVISTVVNTQECFVTPKNKSKNKKCNKSKANATHMSSDTNKTKPAQQKKMCNASSIAVPTADICHTDNNYAEPEENKGAQNNDASLEKVEIPSLNYQSLDIIMTTPKENNVKDQTNISKNKVSTEVEPEIINLVEDLSDAFSPVIPNEIVMGNVTGFDKDEDYSNFIHLEESGIIKLGSTKVPEILSEQMDFDTKTGIFRFKSMRKLSEHSLKVEMEKFYNESWGGEDFNHKEILKHLPRDKSLWRIDPKDRFSTQSKRKFICNYCNRPGHRDELCYRKTPVCHMCGEKGHREPRCPNKICVNCGSPNYIYSSSCRNCAHWHRLTCAECGQLGHPSTHCPDIWRRYHNTIDTESPLVENRQIKQHYQLFCSGCCRRGHLIHQCRSTLPFSGLAINSPYVANYISIYPPTPKDRTPCVQEFGLNSENNSRTQTSHKRQSKSPVTHETHQPKKRYFEFIDDKESVPLYTTKSHQQSRNPDKTQSESGSQQPKQLADVTTDGAKAKNDATEKAQVEPMPDFIPITSQPPDVREQVIQDNEVSTSDVASARIYITKEIAEKLNETNGQDWLRDVARKHNVTTNLNVVESFLSIVGKTTDQEALQADLIDWSQETSNDKSELDQKTDGKISNDEQSQLTYNIPKNRNTLLMKLQLSFESLKQNLGDPKTIFKELNYAQTKHDQLVKQKVISPKQLSNNRVHINDLLKKLNMILLGQAGLGDGWRHRRDLHTLMNRVNSFTNKNVSKELREQIGLHYRLLFTPNPRDDYAELLKIYDITKSKRKRELKGNTVKVALKPLGVNAARQNFQSNRNLSMQDLRNDMVLYQGQIALVRPSGMQMVQRKNRLVAQMKSFIKTIDDQSKVSPKMLKKMWKVQVQAAQFLTKA